MNTEQALQILKQLIDASIKGGIVANIEQTAQLLQAWQTIVTEFTNTKNK